MAQDPRLIKMAIYTRLTIHRRIKAMAALKGQTMSAFVLEAVERYLKELEE